MSNLLALAGQLRMLNETLEGSERVDQLCVSVPVDADESAIAAAIAAEAASRSVSLDRVEQVVIVKRYQGEAAKLATRNPCIADAEEVR